VNTRLIRTLPKGVKIVGQSDASTSGPVKDPEAKMKAAPEGERWHYNNTRYSKEYEIAPCERPPPTSTGLRSSG